MFVYLACVNCKHTYVFCTRAENQLGAEGKFELQGWCGTCLLLEEKTAPTQGLSQVTEPVTPLIPSIPRSDAGPPEEAPLVNFSEPVNPSPAPPVSERDMISAQSQAPRGFWPDQQGNPGFLRTATEGQVTYWEADPFARARAAAEKRKEGKQNSAPNASAEPEAFELLRVLYQRLEEFEGGTSAALGHLKRDFSEILKSVDRLQVASKSAVNNLLHNRPYGALLNLCRVLGVQYPSVSEWRAIIGRAPQERMEYREAGINDMPGDCLDKTCDKGTCNTCAPGNTEKLT